MTSEQEKSCCRLCKLNAFYFRGKNETEEEHRNLVSTNFFWFQTIQEFISISVIIPGHTFSLGVQRPLHFLPKTLLVSMQHCFHLLNLNARLMGNCSLLLVYNPVRRATKAMLPHLHEIKEMYEPNVRRFLFSRCMFCDFVHVINCLYVHLLLSTAVSGNSVLVETL